MSSPTFGLQGAEPECAWCEAGASVVIPTPEEPGPSGLCPCSPGVPNRGPRSRNSGTPARWFFPQNVTFCLTWLGRPGGLSPLSLAQLTPAAVT